MACILEGLEYIHDMQIIHRDIKPENLVFGADGYLHITDFGIARPHKEHNGKDTSGTPGYMAPEIMFQKSHTYNSDLYAVGVMLYELIMKKRPYPNKSRSELRDLISRNEAKITPFEAKHNDIDFSEECIDLVNKLLVRKPKDRIGYRDGVREVKEHPWFLNFDWEALRSKKMEAAFKPVINPELLLEIFKSKGDEGQGRNQYHFADLAKKEIQDKFLNYELEWMERGGLPKVPQEEDTNEKIKPVPLITTNNTDRQGGKKYVRKEVK